MSKHASFLERFTEKYVVSPSGCYDWIGGVQSKGYGSFGVGNKKTQLAHRWALENIAGQTIPPGMTSDHVCNNRRCVNVVVPHAGFMAENPGAVLHGHLRIVTQKTNNDAPHSNVPSGVNARATHCTYGHELSGANLKMRKDGKRACAQCREIFGNDERPRVCSFT